MKTKEGDPRGPRTSLGILQEAPARGLAGKRSPELMSLCPAWLVRSIL